MRPLHALLKLLLLAAVAFDLGGGAWAMRAMASVDQTPGAVEAMPCHGDASSDVAATPHHHGDVGCVLGDCDCGCAVTSTALPVPGAAPALAVPDARYIASRNGHVPDEFSSPGLRPPISA